MVYINRPTFQGSPNFQNFEPRTLILRWVWWHIILNDFFLRSRIFNKYFQHKNKKISVLLTNLLWHYTHAKNMKFLCDFLNYRDYRTYSKIQIYSNVHDLYAWYTYTYTSKCSVISRNDNNTENHNDIHNTQLLGDLKRTIFCYSQTWV